MGVTSVNRKICEKPKHKTRRGSSSKKQTKIGSPFTAADGFLKNKFLPLYLPSTEVPEQSKVERDFLKSLSIMPTLTEDSLSDIMKMPYPYNILLTDREVYNGLNKTNRQIELAILEDEEQHFQLATIESYHIDSNLYYVPVLPLFKLMSNKSEKNSSALLLSVFSYLYRIAQMPYYRDEYTSMAYNYDCLESQFLEDCYEEEPEESHSYFKHLEQAKVVGDIIQQKIHNPLNLDFFKTRIDAYRPKNTFQKDCLRIATNFYSLMVAYPDYSIFRNTGNGGIWNEPEDICRADTYISFIYDVEGLVYEQIETLVNSQMQECAYLETPSVTQIYNDNFTQKEGLDFEYKFFPLLEDLCTLLINIE